MKDQILHYLKHDRSFVTGAKLFQQYGHNLALLRKINIQGNTKLNLEMIHYQLFKLTGEPDLKFREIMNFPVEPVPAEPEPVIDDTPAKQDLVTSAISVVEATKLKLRQEFPFLADKNCPDAFKILVADMLTAYENYLEAHDTLYSVTSEKEAFEAADHLITNYIENRAIWKELDHYRNTGTILGEHAYFEEQKRFREIAAKSVPELIKLKENIEYNLWRNKKKSMKNMDVALAKKRAAAIGKYERDLKHVKSLLNIHD